MSEEMNLLTINEAAGLSGVSMDTIRRYRDLGLLRKYEKDGAEHFSEEDIKLLFNAKIKKVTDSALSGDSTENTAEKEALPRLQDIIREAEGSSGKPLTAETISKSKRTHKENTIHLDTPIDTAGQDSTYHHHQEHLRESEDRISDISSIELLELSRTLKDQLEIVKEERNWLRKRIEKLESLTERDQMLRMSESETIRSLISQREEKRRPWSFLL
jgi:DNA-binding transcriptional MerR regulator